VAQLREYQPKICFSERLRQVNRQLRNELNAGRDYNLKMEEKKAKAAKQDEHEQRIKVNMAKEKNGGQVWM